MQVTKHNMIHVLLSMLSSSSYGTYDETSSTELLGLCGCFVLRHGLTSEDIGKSLLLLVEPCSAKLPGPPPTASPHDAAASWWAAMHTHASANETSDSTFAGKIGCAKREGVGLHGLQTV
jgi:hypothetical protein